MRKIKIAELAPQLDSFYNEDLSQKRKEFWQQKMNGVFQAEWHLVEDPDFQSWLKANKEYDVILFSEEKSAEVLKFLKEIPTEVKNILVADCVIKEGGQYIPRVTVREALAALIPEKSPAINTRGTVYVTGDSMCLRPAISLAVKLGFSNVNLVSLDVDKALEHAEFLRKKFFGINFILMQDAELTLQPCNGDLLLNVVPAEQASFLEAISYLNFLRKDGLVVDMPFSLKQSLLVQESKNTDIACVLPAEIQALRDYEILQRLAVQGLPAKSEYLSLWRDFLNQDKGPVT